MTAWGWPVSNSTTIHPLVSRGCGQPQLQKVLGIRPLSSLKEQF
jgi:hypothetical protein